LEAITPARDLSVRLEYDPLRGAVNPILDESQEPPRVDVLPVWSSPDTVPFSERKV
jgi:hypothetical protein